MTLAQLRYFCLSCEKKSITKAAEKLYVSQPAVSAAIRELEKEFSLRLLERRYKGFQLTSEGECFYWQARQLLDEAEHFSSRMHEMAEKTSSLSLGITRSIGSLVYAEFLPYFVQVHSGIKINTRPASSQELLEALENRQLDAAIMPDPGNLPDSQILTCTLKQVSMVYTVAEKHPLAKEPVLTVPMVCKETMVSTVKDGLKTKILEELFRSYGETPIISQRYDQLITVIHMIRSGFATGFLPEEIVRRNKGITGIPLEGIRPVNVFLAWTKEGEERDAVSCFVKHIRRFYEGGWEQTEKP